MPSLAPPRTPCACSAASTPRGSMRGRPASLFCQVGVLSVFLISVAVRLTGLPPSRHAVGAWDRHLARAEIKRKARTPAERCGVRQSLTITRWDVHEPTMRCDSSICIRSNSLPMCECLFLCREQPGDYREGCSHRGWSHRLSCPPESHRWRRRHWYLQVPRLCFSACQLCGSTEVEFPELPWLLQIVSMLVISRKRRTFYWCLPHSLVAFLATSSAWDICSIV